MYSPKEFRNHDPEKLHTFMMEYPFATLISVHEGAPIVSHLPLILDRPSNGQNEGKNPVLLGHMARANSHWKCLSNSEVLAIFHGPHTYITPKWYEPDPHNVPTWNYTVVHAYGKAKAIQDPIQLEFILRKTSEKFESAEPSPWTFDSLPESRSDLIRAIVGFEIQITRLEGKFKLSQNRNPNDRKGVIQGLSTRKDEMSLKVMELMKAEE